MTDYDLAVIGAGAAGLSVAAGAAQLGARVALIERGAMGGECLNTGCVPSKALLAAAHAARAMREAGRFGLEPAAADPDWDRLRAHVHAVIARIAPIDSAARYRALGAVVLKGEARFIAPAAVAVDGHRISARRFVIATGSRPAVPPVPGLGSLTYWTNETLFDLQERPDHLLILGGGPVGLEMADAFSALGCRVTIVEARRIAGTEDPELAAGLRTVLNRQGVTILENAEVLSAERGPALILGDGRRVAGSHLLVAAGRVPNLEALDLPAGNVRAGPRGIATDRSLRSLTNPRVFAAGDIADPAGVGPRHLTHAGAYHATLLMRRLLFRLPARLDYAALPRVIYTSPELAQTGMTEAEALAAGLTPRVLRWPLADNDRAVAEGQETGLVKLVVSGNRIIGAGILAPHAGEMISLWSLAIARRVRLSALAGLIMPYPTLSEAAKRAASSSFAARLFSSRTRTLVRVLRRLP